LAGDSPESPAFFFLDKTISWRTRLFSGGQDYSLADKTISWRARSFQKGQAAFSRKKVREGNVCEMLVI